MVITNFHALKKKGGGGGGGKHVSRHEPILENFYGHIVQ